MKDLQLTDVPDQLQNDTVRKQQGDFRAHNSTSHSEQNILHHHKLLQLLHRLINSPSEPSSDGRVQNIIGYLGTGVVTYSTKSLKRKHLR